MADKKISQLDAAGALDGSERIPLEQAGVTKQIPSGTLREATPEFVDGGAMHPVQGSPSESSIKGRRVAAWSCPDDGVTHAVAGSLLLPLGVSVDLYVWWSNPSGTTTGAWDAEVRLQHWQDGNPPSFEESAVTASVSAPGDSNTDYLRRSLIGTVTSDGSQKLYSVTAAKLGSGDLGGAVRIAGVEAEAA